MYPIIVIMGILTILKCGIYSQFLSRYANRIVLFRGIAFQTTPVQIVSAYKSIE
jgi:hypothetical protein